MFGHCIQDSEQFTHTSCQGHLFSFAGITKALIEVPDDRVVPCRYYSSHVEDRPHSGTPSPDGTFATKSTAVTVKWCYSHKSSYLTPVQSTEFGKLSQKCRRDNRSYSGNTLQQVIFFSPDWTLSNDTTRGIIYFIQLLLQPSDVSLNTSSDCLMGRTRTIPLRSEHLAYLTSPCQNIFKFLRLSIGQGSWRRVYGCCEMGDNMGIDDIGFSQPASGFSKVPYLTWIDHCRCYPGYRQSRYQGPLKVPRGFQHYQHRRYSADATHSFGNANIVITEAPSLLRRMHSYVDSFFGNINAYVYLLFIHNLLSSPFCPSLHDTGSLGPGNCSGLLGDRVRRPTLNNGLLDQGFIGLPHLSLPIRIPFIGDTRIWELVLSISPFV